jgi:hypothetical protein
MLQAEISTGAVAELMLVYETAAGRRYAADSGLLRSRTILKLTRLLDSTETF